MRGRLVGGWAAAAKKIRQAEACPLPVPCSALAWFPGSLALETVETVVRRVHPKPGPRCALSAQFRSEEHTSELQSLMRISYAVFCLKKKKYKYRLNLKRNTNHDYLIQATTTNDATT